MCAYDKYCKGVKLNTDDFRRDREEIKKEGA